MIKLWNGLRTDEVIGKKTDKIINKLKNKEILFDIYCVAIASNEKNLFDIINTNELLSSHYLRNEIKIVGLAAGKDSAVTLAAGMLLEIYLETGDFIVRDYYKF